MNLAEPSGSSPPEKPPGMQHHLAVPDGAWPEPRHGLGQSIGGQVADDQRSPARCPPRPGQARAVSYSQLVPGKTGMTGPWAWPPCAWHRTRERLVARRWAPPPRSPAVLGGVDLLQGRRRSASDSSSGRRRSRRPGRSDGSAGWCRRVFWRRADRHSPVELGHDGAGSAGVPVHRSILGL